MSQKLVLSVDDNKIQLQDFAAFVKRCEVLKFGPRMEIEVTPGADGKILFTVPIPENAPMFVNGKAVRKAALTKVQQAVAKQISDHKEAVAKGEPVEGHVKALVKTPVKKGLCPQCRLQKPLTRVGLIKTHTIGGKKCIGTGQKPVIVKQGIKVTPLKDLPITPETHGKVNLSPAQKKVMDALGVETSLPVKRVVVSKKKKIRKAK